MAILNKRQFKYSIRHDIAVLVILIVTQSLLHEASHALAVIVVGGKVDAMVVHAFDPEQSYVAYRLVYSDYAELYHAIVKLLPHVLLGIIGFYLVHKGMNRLRQAGKEAVGKYTYLSIGGLYSGIGLWCFLPLRYLNLRFYHQFDIPQATLHLSSFAHSRLSEPALFLSNLPSEFHVRLLVFGLISLSGMIYVGLWLSLLQVGHSGQVGNRIHIYQQREIHHKI